MQGEPERESWASALLPLGLILGLVVLLAVPLGPGSTEGAGSDAMEQWIKFMVGYLAAGAEIVAAGVIGIAIVRATLGYLRGLLGGGRRKADVTEALRLDLGRGLALGLEFTVASDILRTAVAPTREDIVTLGAIVMLRTLLNYFLEREIRLAEHRIAGSSTEQAEP